MARRKKEPAEVHRTTIASAAEGLFATKGISLTTMDDIAREAGYSKATLYVYFKNKEDIVGFLTLKSMNLLLDSIRTSIAGITCTKEQYLSLCKAMIDFQQEHPLYFEIILEEINVDFEKPNALDVEKEIFNTGELINREIAAMLINGIESGALRRNLEILPTVFLFWASLSGTIQLAAKKKRYLEKGLNITQNEFLSYGFETLYHSIKKD